MPDGGSMEPPTEAVEIELEEGSTLIPMGHVGRSDRVYLTTPTNVPRTDWIASEVRVVGRRGTVVRSS